MRKVYIPISTKYIIWDGIDRKFNQIDRGEWSVGDDKSNGDEARNPRGNINGIRLWIIMEMQYG